MCKSVTDKQMIRIVEQATELNNLFLEVRMAIGFLRAFLTEEENFEELWEDICDSYSALVIAQINLGFLEILLENLKRKVNI